MEPFAYHRNVTDYLEQNEPELWGRMAGARDAQQAEVRLHLLKTCYKLSPEAHAALHQAVAEVCEALHISAQVTLYQATHADASNISIYLGENEAFIIFQGPVLDLLTDDEIKAVLAHELSHFLLWQRDNRRYWIASQILDQLAADDAAAEVWAATAIRFQQHTEIFADMGAYRACGDIAPCISSLVKVQTGLKQVHAESYLRQADEIFDSSTVVSDELSHPQAYIRARALKLHRDNAPDAAQTIGAMLSGPLALDKLDILDQIEVQKLTLAVLARLLAPEWFRSDAVLALARRYAEDFAPGAAGAEDTIALPAGHQLDEYLSFVLLDFVGVDASLEDYPAMAALQLAEKLGISDTFERLLLKETKLKKTQLNRLKKEAAAALREADAKSSPETAT